MTGRHLYFRDCLDLANEWHKAARRDLANESIHKLMKGHSTSFKRLPEEISVRYERAALAWKTKRHNELVEEEESMWNRLALLQDQLEEQEGPSTGASCLNGGNLQVGPGGCC